jgi:hypothetical protein
MKMRAGLAIAATVAVAACTSLTHTGGVGSGTGPSRPPCKPGSECATDLSVTFCSISEPVVITVEDGGVDLVWNLDPGMLGYTFVGKGITVLQDPNNEFSPPRVTGNKVTIHDANTHRGEHKYDVTIQNRFTTCKALDPTIVNKGQG